MVEGDALVLVKAVLGLWLIVEEIVASVVIVFVEVDSDNVLATREGNRIEPEEI